MSTLINSYNSLIFGSQNPFRNYLTEPGLKNTFFRLMLDKSSKIYKSKSWKVFCLANKIFPNKTAEIDEHIKHGIGKLLDPFINTNIKNIESSVLQTTKQAYSMGEITFTDELIKSTGVKNTIGIIADYEKEHCGTRHGIVTYLTRDMSKGVCNDLEPTWSNKFFKFVDPDNLCLVVIIPKQYLISLIQNVVSATVPVGSSFIDKTNIRSNLIDEFSIDLVKSIFTAIYSDGIRNRINSDILLFNSLLQKEGLNVSSKTENVYQARQNADDFQKYAVQLKQFKKSSNDEHFIYNMLQFNQTYGQTSRINPHEFYETFIDTPYAYIEDIFARCTSFQRLSNQSINYVTFNYENSLKDMDFFASDRDRNVVIFGLKIVRFLPYLLFNTYIMGGGNAHNETKQIIETAKKTLPFIMGFKASNNWTAPAINFIVNNIIYLTETLFTEISSPLTVTDGSRSALTYAINKFGYVEDSILGTDVGVGETIVKQESENV